MWPTIIVVLVIAMMVGPVMLMKPTRAQKHLALLRKQAQTLGLKVGASDVKGEGGQLCWFYWLPLNTDNGPAPVVLERQKYEHGLHIAKYWLVKGRTPTEPQLWESFLAKLPDSVYAVELNDHALGVHWNERGGDAVLEQLANQLKAFASPLV
ncbi:MAG TPA: hypothetical protein VIC26_16815 [Marinagarivorans sp.]